MNRLKYAAAFVITVAVSSCTAALYESVKAGIGPAVWGVPLLIICAAFDLVFCVLFIYESVAAYRTGRYGLYMKQRGWMEFSWSVPPILVYSVPAVILLVADNGSGAAAAAGQVSHYAAVAGAAGILRVSRIARIASVREIIPSPMTGRYMRTACNAAAASVFCAMIIISAAAELSSWHGSVGDLIHAVSSCTASIVLLSVLTGILLVCTGYFNRSVSVPLSVMDRGFRRREFNLRADIPFEQRDDEIWRIASFYNESFLPAKMRQNIKNPEPAVRAIPETALDNFSGTLKKSGM